MDPVIFIASSRLKGFKQDRVDAIKDFYHTHWHLPLRLRFKGVSAFYRQMRALVHAPSAKHPGIVPLAARMVK